MPVVSVPTQYGHKGAMYIKLLLFCGPSSSVQLFISTISNLGTKRHRELLEDAKQMKASPSL